MKLLIFLMSFSFPFSVLASRLEKGNHELELKGLGLGSSTATGNFFKLTSSYHFFPEDKIAFGLILRHSLSRNYSHQVTGPSLKFYFLETKKWFAHFGLAHLWNSRPHSYSGDFSFSQFYSEKSLGISYKIKTKYSLSITMIKRDPLDNGDFVDSHSSQFGLSYFF